MTNGVKDPREGQGGTVKRSGTRVNHKEDWGSQDSAIKGVRREKTFTVDPKRRVGIKPVDDTGRGNR